MRSAYIFGFPTGLWVADLNANQILQEGVEESHRGVINGVQNSLNQLANLLKFFLVIVFPSPQAFGYLIFLTWIFMFFGYKGNFLMQVFCEDLLMLFTFIAGYVSMFTCAVTGPFQGIRHKCFWLI
jgi:hypothetical protein